MVVKSCFSNFAQKLHNTKQIAGMLDQSWSECNFQSKTPSVPFFTDFLFEEPVASILKEFEEDYFR